VINELLTAMRAAQERREPVYCLGAGFVRYVDHMGNDLSIVRAARVSYNADWRSGSDDGKDAKLIAYLLRHQHTSPFEHVTVTFEVKAPLFVLRQWHRHRTQSYSEISARYTELDEGYYVPAAEQITTQHQSNKQMRTATVHPQAAEMRQTIVDACDAAFADYRELIRCGVPRELARSVLPTATYSRMFATANLHNWLRFLALRSHEHAQYEIRVYAEAILAMLTGIVPHTMAAWEELNAHGKAST
jgi:thymidylate synthase (FAD)